ncbi:bacillithiol biosynthesis cysteine-adding enzyme BshC [Galbibacter pacificus]|uniref:Putative cysteine ligase BshC n=1 Tax=Galbibacter pacificus TaxID=2996052 RepID=A0ABT6FMF4_9FLAO|nr:bacillithiol biosynthesis cysteine-adding enzyme BshC [Galbibacter pacificus]MDG3580970.1 bacillithiol biosynthesis cysteine-adding enzyme BshC [Galbibacter pacificus]MDG3584448.1 bacillithiol biosynthesis cysteine-adding enzyme BshC [Galbibacter pacificus]
MPTNYISFQKTGYFSKLICNYISQEETLRPFYNRYPTLDNFKGQIEEKKSSFPCKNREILASVLKKQYKNIQVTTATLEHIEALKKNNAFTVVTGHQLNLFSGPLYFLYKIVSTINLTKKLNQTYPGSHFVPVYWMATEDHDFEEINYFNFNGKKFQWQGPKTSEEGGAVGELPTKGLEQVLELFSLELGMGKNAEQLKKMFQQAYIGHDNLTDATRFLANELFGDQGLVIIDGAEKKLKELFVPYIKNELFKQDSHQEVSKTINELNKVDPSYKIQVNPRDINLFYLAKGLRGRIVEVDGGYAVHETDISWNKDELEAHIEAHPERFSPNVVTRPLYQEVILPNLCYIGGGGELAYWLELKSFFKQEKVPFPMLLLRNSVLIITKKQADKLEKLNISLEQLFLKKHSFINRKVREISNIDINFDPQKEHLVAQFQEMYRLAELTDKSFLGAVKAQEVKQLKGLEHLEKRLLKAQKRKLSDQVSRMTDIQNELFPNESLQERTDNFANLYQAYGHVFINLLLSELYPLRQDFVVITV